MIFVTVGTHEQPLNRLVEKLDELVGNQVITDDVIIQSGFCDYDAQHVKTEQFLGFDEMDSYMTNADVVITHGGPASFMAALAKGKQPIVVPRLLEYGEHVNNHQLDFCEELVKRGISIGVVTDMDQLAGVIKRTMANQTPYRSNNDAFNHQFKQVLNEVLA